MKSIAASMPGTLLNSGGLGAPPAATGPGAPPARRRSSRPRGPRTAGGGRPLAQEAEDRIEEREQVPEELGRVPRGGLAEGERPIHGADLEVEHVLPEGLSVQRLGGGPVQDEHDAGGDPQEDDSGRRPEEGEDGPRWHEDGDRVDPGRTEHPRPVELEG